MISKNFALNLQTCLSGNPFSLDELILETKFLFENEGVPGFLKAIIILINEMVVEQWKTGNMASCCDVPHLNRNGRRSKSFYTSLGNLSLEWSVLRCKNCDKTHHPLKEFFELGKYQKLSTEFEKICLETVARESFRNSTETLKLHKTTEFNHRTLHRWFMETDADEIKVAHKDLNVILGDGTGYKKFVSQKELSKKNKLREKLGQKPIEISKRGEVRILMGINKNNKVIPLGAWTRENWKVIGNLIHKANNPNKKLAPKKVANIVVADGEIGLNRGLHKLAHHHQRCLWHIPHDLKPLMKYQDKAEEEDIKYALNQVHSIFQLEIPEKDFKEIEDKDLIEINEKIKDCEMQMKLLSDYLNLKGYSQAATYVANSRSSLFTYLKYWMKTGIVTPKVTSKLERLMREINRRIKKFAFNWSEKGCAKITRIIIKLLTDVTSWENHFDKKMRLSGNIKLSFEGVS
jgi:hypothetical protein